VIGTKVFLLTFLDLEKSKKHISTRITVFLHPNSNNKLLSKILAIDFDLKRTDLALSDESKIFAFGLQTIDSKTLMDELKKLVSKEKITEIVIGEPKRLDTSDSHITQNVRLLKEAVQKVFPEVLVCMLDERFTSKMASAAIAQSGLKKKDREQKGLIDTVSATIILQDYLQTRIK
jgi:putative holliday junction resolvase